MKTKKILIRYFVDFDKEEKVRGWTFRNRKQRHRQVAPENGWSH